MLSIVFLSYFSGDRARKCYERLGATLDAAGIPFEFVVMDDGSTDDSYANAVALAREHVNVRAYRLSRNFGQHYSVFAGLTKCAGACAMPVCDDEQQPYETVVEAYRRWAAGNKVVIPCRAERADGFVSRLFATSFYKIMNALSDVHYPEGGADVFLIDREVIDILNARIHPINTSSIAEVLRLGFDPVFLPFRRPEGMNDGKSRWTWRKKMRLAKDNFFSASTFPIKLIFWLGLTSFLGAFGVAIAYVTSFLCLGHLPWGRTVPGWLSLSVLICAFGGLILLSLGLIAEYIWRIYEEVKNRPGYVIRAS